MPGVIKVTVLKAETKCSFYIQNHLNYNFMKFNSDLRDILMQLKYPDSGLRLFWIDDDKEEIEIRTNTIIDFEAFRCYESKSNSVKQIFVSYVEEEKQKKAEAAKEQEQKNTFVHKRVTCDSCNIENIKGFRYKCMQCEDYDLCENCEAKHIHNEHVMLRMPDDRYLEECWAFRMLNPQLRKRSARRTCPFAAGYKKSADESSNSAEEATDENKYRKRSKQQHPNMRSSSNGFSKFFDMFNDLAEAGTNAATLQANNAVASANEAVAAATAAAAAAANIGAAHMERDGAQQYPNIQQTIPLVAGMQHIDPNYMKKGIEILSNFSDLFGKMLDTMDTCSVASSSINSATKTAESNEEVKDVNGSAAAAKNVEKMDVTEARGSSIEGEWQIIGNKNQPSGSSSSTSTPDLIDWRNNNGNVNCEQLSKDLKSHLKLQDETTENKENAKKENTATTPVAVVAPPAPAPPSPAPTPSAPTPPATPVAVAAPPAPTPLAVPVFHSDPNINEGVMAMMAMGFSNEGGYLADLLVASKGNISAVLDIIAIAQREPRV